MIIYDIDSFNFWLKLVNHAVWVSVLEFVKCRYDAKNKICQSSTTWNFAEDSKVHVIKRIQHFLRELFDHPSYKLKLMPSAFWFCPLQFGEECWRTHLCLQYLPFMPFNHPNAQLSGLILVLVGCICLWYHFSASQSLVNRDRPNGNFCLVSLFSF